MQENKEEIWRDVIDFNGIYQVSNKGRIKSVKRKVNSRYGEYKTVPEKYLALNKDKNTHYISITLSLNCKRITRFIHRLVAEAFIDNPENKCCVNHIDGDVTNNCVENLEWVTMSENSKHAYSKSRKRIKTNWNREEVIEFGNKVKEYCKDGWKEETLHRVFFEWDKWVEENL